MYIPALGDVTRPVIFLEKTLSCSIYRSFTMWSSSTGWLDGLLMTARRFNLKCQEQSDASEL